MAFRIVQFVLDGRINRPLNPIKSIRQSACLTAEREVKQAWQKGYQRLVSKNAVKRA